MLSLDSKGYAKLPRYSGVAFDQHGLPLDKRQTSLPTTFHEVRIRAAYYGRRAQERLAGPMETKQLNDLMKQVSFPQVTVVSVSIRAPGLLDAFDPDACLSSLIQACNQFRVPNLTEASLQISLSPKGSTRKMDACVSVKS